MLVNIGFHDFRRRRLVYAELRGGLTGRSARTRFCGVLLRLPSQYPARRWRRRATGPVGFVVFADTLVRTAFAGQSLPVGVTMLIPGARSRASEPDDLDNRRPCPYRGHLSLCQRRPQRPSRDSLGVCFDVDWAGGANPQIEMIVLNLRVLLALLVGVSLAVAKSHSPGCQVVYMSRKRQFDNDSCSPFQVPSETAKQDRSPKWRFALIGIGAFAIVGLGYSVSVLAKEPSQRNPVFITGLGNDNFRGRSFFAV